MSRSIFLVLPFLALISSCSRPGESQVENSGVDSSATKTTDTLTTSIALPDFVARTPLPDTLVIDAATILTGDFNADGKNDFASLVTNSLRGYRGVLIVHNSPSPEYFVFGAGIEVDEMVDLNWIGIFQVIPKGEVVAPTLLDEETGDILGMDDSKAVVLTGNGLYVHVDEGEGGGILIWRENKYEWYHVE